MMKEQLISFETAKLAKEKGVFIPTLKHYNILDPESITAQEEGWEYTLNAAKIPFCYNNTTINCYDAPTQSLLQKWLRESESIDIIIHRDIDNYQCCLDVHGNDSASGYWWFEDWSYEQALEKGLQEALKLIK